jgi:hypothetical protein
MAPKIRFGTLRNYNDLEGDKCLSSFKYLIKELNKKICIQIDMPMLIMRSKDKGQTLYFRQ